MAPPIPGQRQPVAVRRRSAGDVLAGILAVVLLALLTVGVPLGLLTVFGLPWPHSRPTLSLLTHQLDSLAILKILTIIVWLAWLQLVWCVLAEVTAAVRNTGMPARVPLAGGTQALAHRLVTAALLLFTATAALSPAFGHHAPPRTAAPVTATAQARLGGQGAFPSGPAAASAVSADAVPARHGAEKVYVVRPPVGRYHESLWEIAQNHLGDGRRYHEIFELNKDKVQPDGTRLTIASLIRPGWILRMPADAHGPGIEIVRPHGDAARPAGEHAMPGHAGSGHAGSGRQAAAPAGHAGTARHDAGAAVGYAQTAFSRYPYELAAASLLAAGVLAALGRRRREQLWRRAFGRRVPVPPPDAALAEAALRLGAAEPSARLLDSALRQLSGAIADAGGTLPNVFAARLGAGHLDLWVAPADPNPPAPWSAAADGRVWRLLRDAGDGTGVPEPGSAALAPFPGLVSVGTDEAGRVLVDLEAAQGLIAVTGPQATVHAALAAIAVELATNLWSDRMQVVLVGFGEELVTIAPDRMRAVRTLAEALPDLEARAAEAEAALDAAGVGSVLTGRCRGVLAAAWMPQYLIMAEPPSGPDTERLLALARAGHRTAAGYVVAGEVREATWTWELTAEGRLRAGLLGFDVQAQLLPPQQYAAVAELFRAADEPAAGTPARTPAAAVAPAAQLVPGTALPVQVSMLGPVSVVTPGMIEADRLALATEIVAYLAANPAGVHPNVLTGAIWPRGVTAEVRDASLDRVRDWLGTDAAGQPALVTEADGRTRLGPQVRVDLNVFRTLVARAVQEAARGGDAEAGYLERALDEVRGPLLDGRAPGRYAWLATSGLENEVAALVADAAHRLSELRRAAGDPAGAMAAARAGLRLASDDEILWRDLLLAADATGDELTLRSVVDEVSARAALDAVLPRMAPQTESLIDELLPSWRTSVA
jgi:hypothetical protein